LICCNASLPVTSEADIPVKLCVALIHSVTNLVKDNFHPRVMNLYPLSFPLDMCKSGAIQLSGISCKSPTSPNVENLSL
jgi:hypothetical protein